MIYSSGNERTQYIKVINISSRNNGHLDQSSRCVTCKKTQDISEFKRLKCSYLFNA